MIAGLAGSGTAAPQMFATTVGPLDVLGAAALLFFAFAGYARIATLGEEVRDPARTIPRAVPLALGIVLLVYAAVGGTVLLVLGPAGAAASPRPVAAVAGAVGADRLEPVVA
ncbi:MAG: amino acid permease, partial [Jiangellaceae bacterium]